MPNQVRPNTTITCTPKRLDPGLRIQAAQKAVEINPVNHAPVERLSSVIPGCIALPEHIAVITTKYWWAKGVRLTVGFLEPHQAQLEAAALASCVPLLGFEGKAPRNITILAGAEAAGYLCIRKSKGALRRALRFVAALCKALPSKTFAIGVKKIIN